MKSIFLLTFAMYFASASFSQNEKKDTLKISILGKTGNFNMKFREVASIKKLEVSDSRCKIISFDLTMKTDDGLLETKSASGNVLTTGQLSMLSSIKDSKEPTKRVSFENVRIKISDQKIIPLTGINITVEK